MKIYNKKFNVYFVIFLILFISSLTLCLGEIEKLTEPVKSITEYEKVTSKADISLTDSVLVSNDATTMDIEFIDGNLKLSDVVVHNKRDIALLESTLIKELKGYNGHSVQVFHINDGGIYDYIEIHELVKADGYVYLFDIEFSEVIIDGYVGTYEVTAYNLSVSDSLNFGQTFNASNVTSLSVNVTDDATKAHPYDINTTGLVGWWKLDDDYIDSSGNGNNGTAHGDTHFVNGKYNNGTVFDGVDDYIDCGNDTSLNVSYAYTLSAWIKNPNSTGNDRSIFGKDGSGNERIFQFRIDNGAGVLRFIRFDNSNSVITNIVSSNIVDNNHLHYVVAVFDNTSGSKIYIDGEMDGSDDVLTDNNIGTEKLLIGARNSIGLSDKFNGFIDNAHIYNRALSATEIKYNYYDHLQQLKIKTDSNSTWSTEWNNTADNLINVLYADGEFFSLLNFTVPETVVQNGITIYDYPNTVQFDAIATVGYTEDITKITETATAGTYTLNVTHAANNTGEGYINYTTANSVLLDADFWNSANLSSDNPNASLSSTLPHFSISTGYVASGTEYYYLVEQDYFYSPQNLASTTDVDQIYFDWDNHNNVDYWNISQLDITIPFTSAYAVLDGIKDACYTCCCAYGFVGDAPNPYTTHGQETIYILRNDTYLILYADGEDNDNFNNDDNFIVGIDASNNNLTTDDRKFILNEGGTVTAKEWTGSAWNPVTTEADGRVIGGGTAGAIQYEMFIPVSELDTNFTNGSTVKFFMSRTHTASNPDIESYYPQTLQNTTDATLWQSVLLSSEAQYTYINNTTTSSYTVTGLDPFTWYQHRFTTINGSQESSAVNSADITLDTPSYTVSGYIKDTSGNPIANADVWGENGYPLEHNVSNASGHYTGTHFHNGTYTIYANATGYAVNSTPITVAGANLTNVNITLQYSQYFPSTPTNLTYSTYNFGINYSFIEGLNLNNTDSYNITFNGTQYNGVTDLFFNKSVDAHGYGNITIYAYNNTNDGALSATFLTNNTTIPNNNINITNGSPSAINEGQIVNVDFNYTDLDPDTPTFSTNRNDLFTNFNITTGVGSWTTSLSSSGNYLVDFGVSDGYGSTSNYSMSITIIRPATRGPSGVSSKPSSGGVGVSGENLDNILYKESSIIYYAQYNKTVKVNFDNHNLHNIKSITYTPTKNAQNIGITVEKLKTKSIYAKTFPPHILYSNVNIWVGQSDYSNNLKDAQIEFTVPKEWIIKNAVTKISLMHYNLDNNKWEKLPTKMTKVSSNTYTYTATTQSFSPFAIVGESISTTHFIPLSEKIINILPENLQEPINKIINNNEKISSSINNADSNLNLISAKIRALILNNYEIIISLILIIIVSLLFTVITAIDSTLIHILLTVALMGLIYLLTQDFYPLEHYITENISNDLLNKIKYTRGLLSTLIYLLITIIPAQYIKEKIDK